MKIFYIVIFYSLFIFSKNIFGNDVNKTTNVVKISTGEYRPFTGKNVYANGFVLDVIRKSFELKGYEVEYKFFPWARAYKELLDDNVDASAYYYSSKKRKKDCFFSQKIFTEKTVFFYNKKIKIKPWEKLSDLSQYKFGATLGYTYTDEFWDMANVKILKVHASQSDQTNFKKLINGRINIFPCTLIRAKYILERLFPFDEISTLDYLKRPLSVSEGHLLFLRKSDKAEKLLSIFNDGLNELIENKTYEKMYKDLLNGVYAKKVEQ